MKKLIKAYVFCILFLVISSSYAQLPYTFTQTARNTHYGTVEDIAIGSSGIVFLAMRSGGLKAYNYIDSNLVFLAQIDDDSYTNKVLIGPGGIIFSVENNWRNDEHRLSAYNFDGISFTKKADIELPDLCSEIALGPDSTIFVITYGGLMIAYTFKHGIFIKEPHAQITIGGYPGAIALNASGIIFTTNMKEIQAYQFNGSTFRKITFIDVYDVGEEGGLAIGPDGTIFLTVSNYQDHTGLFAYKFVDSTFVYVTHINVPGSRWSGGDIAIGPDGTVFLEKRTSELLIAFEYDGSSFKNSGYINIGLPEEIYVGSNGDIFIGNVNELSIYHFDGTTFKKAANLIKYGSANDVTTDNNGLVFLANGGDGLRVYNYDGTSLINIAHAFTDSGSALGVTLGPNGTIFLANGIDGLRAYKSDGNTLINTAHTPIGAGYAIKVFIGADGTVFLSRQDRGFEDGVFQAYSYDGKSFTFLATTSFESGFTNDVAMSDDGTIFLANTGNIYARWGGAFSDDDGLRACEFDGHSFVNIAHADIDDYEKSWATGIALGLDGKIFLANGRDGVRVYNYDGSSFSNIAFTSVFNGFAYDVAVGSDGTLFVSNFDYSSNSLLAYKYNNNPFLENIAQTEDIGNAKSVTIARDGTIFLANGDEGLIAYEYSEITSLSDDSYNNPKDFNLKQNYPNPFNPVTNIEFSIPNTEFVTLKVYNILGKQVATILSEKLNAGDYHYSWNAGSLSSGVYIYKLEAGNFVESRKMILMR